MRRSLITLGIALCALGACADHAPARIVFASDTIHVNTTLWTDPGVSAVDARGKPIEDAAIALRATPESLVVVSAAGLRIRCMDDGTGRLEARIDALYAARSVDCHLVRSGTPMRVHQLGAGGPPEH